MRTILWVAFVVIALMGNARAGNYGKYDLDARYVWILAVFVAGPQQKTLRFETTDLQGGADTQIHVWDVWNNRLVAWNDDYPLGNCQPEGYPEIDQSCVEFTTPGSGGSYAVVVISAPNTINTGTADVIQRTDGVQTAYYDNILVGGTWTHVDISGPDTLQTALLNQGTEDTILLGTSSAGALNVIDDDSGVGFASKIAATPVDWVATGTCSALPGEEQGMARLLANDLYFDNDGDGLGPALEAAMCSCDYWGHYSCWDSCVVDNYLDSDYDGIRDDYETFGKDDGQAPQELPRWGADPARMDLFIEADYMEGAQKVPGYEVEKTARAYEWQAPGSGQYLLNRDGSDGIRVHLDTGLWSAGTIFGDWGGGGQEVLAGVSLDQAYDDPTYFAPVRKGIFHYALVHGGNAGSSPVYAPKFGAVWSSGENIAHECGHNLGLHHCGLKSAFDANAKPHYRSIMNYGFSMNKLGAGPHFSLGTFSQVPLNPVDLCEGDGLLTEDRSQVAYLEAPPFSYLVEASCNTGQNMKCGIDWNRDGTISECSTPVRAAPNQVKGTSENPEIGRYYWQWGPDDWSYFPADPDETSTPSLARAFGKMHLAFRELSGWIKLMHTSHDFKAGCGDPWGHGCAPWTILTVASAADAAGPAMVAFSNGRTEYLMVVYKVAGALEYKVLNSSYGTVASDSVPGTSGALFEPVLGVQNGQVMLLFRAGAVRQEATIYGKSYTLGGGWTTAVSQVLDGQTMQAYSAGALAAAPGGPLRVVLSRLDDPEQYHTWAEHQGSNTWTTLNATAMESHRVDGDAQTMPIGRRVGLAWRPFGGSLSGGRWYLVYNPMDRAPEPEKGIPRMGTPRLNMTRGDGVGTALVWENAVRYDNVWHKLKGGFDLLGGPAEESLRGAMVFWKGAGDFHLIFRPFADGIISAQMKDVNDWMVMRVGLCASLQSCQDPNNFCPQSCVF